MQNVPTRPAPAPRPRRKGAFTLFSPRGRLGRLQYLVICLVLLLGAGIALAAPTLSLMYEMPLLGRAMSTLLIQAQYPVWALLLAILLLSTVKRVHDADLPWFYALLALIPMAPVVFMILPGTPRPNRFGETRSNRHLYWNAPLVALLPALLLLGASVATLHPAPARPLGEVLQQVRQSLTGRYSDGAYGLSLTLPAGWISEEAAPGLLHFFSPDGSCAVLAAYVLPQDGAPVKDFAGQTKEQLQVILYSVTAEEAQNYLGTDITPKGDIRRSVERIGGKWFLCLQEDGWDGSNPLLSRRTWYRGDYYGGSYMMVVFEGADASPAAKKQAEAMAKSFRVAPPKK